MIDYILEKFTSIASKCLEENAKELKTKKQDLQLVFKLDEENNDVKYVIYNNWVKDKEITFLQVLRAKIDFKGYSLFVPKFIKGALNRFCEECKIEKDVVSVVLFFNEQNKMVMYLYNNITHLKQIELEELFDTTDIINQ